MSGRLCKKLAFFACAGALVLMIVAMVFVVVMPYDMDMLVDAYLDDDLDEKTLLAASRLKEARRDVSSAGLSGTRAEVMAGPLSDRDALLAQILNPGVIDPDGLAPCSASLAEITAHTSAQSWANKKLNKLRNHFAEFKRTFVETLARTRYCIAQCNMNTCCSGNEGYRWGSDDDWYLVIKNDLKPLSDDDGLSDISLVTQGSADRVDVFAMIANAWSGPKVAVFAVYDYDEETHASAVRQIDSITKAAVSWLNVKVIVYPVKKKADFFTDKFATYDAASKPLLPLNTMRNLAMDHANTNFVFTCDMDFVPSTTLYPRVKDVFLPMMAAVDRGAFVVPHWEALECESTVRVPRDFTNLLQYGAQGIVRPFHVSAKRIMPLIKEIKTPPLRCDAPAAVWSFGVQTSNYNKWFKESQDGIDGFFPLEVEGPTKDIYWEPFVIVKRVEPSGARLPRYHEQYVGRYKNKIAFITMLRAFHYQFFTLRRDFLMHVPHATANASAPAMHEHLLNMRKLHADDRQQLHDDVWSHPPDPALESSPFDNGVHCTRDASSPQVVRQ